MRTRLRPVEPGVQKKFAVLRSGVALVEEVALVAEVAAHVVGVALAAVKAERVHFLLSGEATEEAEAVVEKLVVVAVAVALEEKVAPEAIGAEVVVGAEAVTVGSVLAVVALPEVVGPVAAVRRVLVAAVVREGTFVVACAAVELALFPSRRKRALSLAEFAPGLEEVLKGMAVGKCRVKLGAILRACSS